MRSDRVRALEGPWGAPSDPLCEINLVTLHIVFPQPDHSSPAEAEALRVGFIVFRNQLQSSIYRTSESLCGLSLTKTPSSEPCWGKEACRRFLPARSTLSSLQLGALKHGRPPSSELATGRPADAPSRGNRCDPCWWNAVPAATGVRVQSLRPVAFQHRACPFSSASCRHWASTSPGASPLASAQLPAPTQG